MEETVEPVRDPGLEGSAVADDAEPPARTGTSWSAVAAFALGALPVSLLATENGGYGAIVRGDVGVLAWFAVLCGAAAGVLPRRAIPRRALVAAGLLIAHGAWTAAGIPGSESAERAVAELGRVATLSGILVLALSLQTRSGAMPALAGMATSIVGVAAVALAYRVHPAWFSASTELILPGARGRLSFPLGYWNGLAALMAIGFPLGLAIACTARHATVRAGAAAVLPVLVLVVGLTLSRGGFVLLAVAAVLSVALGPRRIGAAVLAVAGGALGSLLIAAAYARSDLVDGARTALANDQGATLIPLILVAAAVAAGVRIGLDRTEDSLTRLVARPPRAAYAAGAAALLVLAIAAGAAFDVPGSLRDRWSQFRTPDIPLSQKDRPSRLSSGSGTGRYQFWQAAIKAGNRTPLTGIGAGAFELWWARTAPVSVFARDAHSLYLESYAELGVPGLLLIVAFLVAVLWSGGRRALRGPPDVQATAAAATTGVAVFAVAAGIDWAWELTILPASALVLAALALGPGSRLMRRPVGARAAWAAIAVIGLATVALPLLESAALRQSQARAAAGDLSGAIALAATASDLEPDAAGPKLERALLLEQSGDLPGASTAAAQAAKAEPTNWRIWVIRARIAAQRGRAAQALDFYRVARSLGGSTPAINPPG